MSARHAFYLWNDLAVHMGEVIPSDPHRHFAAQICLGLGGRFALRAGEREHWQVYTAALIPSGVSHQTDAQPAGLAMVYFDPATPFMHAAQAWAGDTAGIAPIPTDVAEAAIANLRAAGDQPDAIRRAIEDLLITHGSDQRKPLDERIAVALGILGSQPDAPPSMPELAQRVDLSASRFRHLFRDEMGSTYSAYRLWNRVVHACRLLAVRPDLTWAAHEAGFADSAHFSRAFHRTFGLTPSDIFKSSDVSLVVCA